MRDPVTLRLEEDLCCFSANRFPRTTATGSPKAAAFFSGWEMSTQPGAAHATMTRWVLELLEHKETA